MYTSARESIFRQIEDTSQRYINDVYRLFLALEGKVELINNNELYT